MSLRWLVGLSRLIGRWQQQEPQPAQPLSTRVIVLWGVVVVGSGLAALTMLWRLYGDGADVSVKLELIRTAGGVMVVVGGAVTLLLAARRQRSTEQMLEHQRLTLEHQREVDRATAEDADKRRITELYARAVDQLGAEKAPVRLGGLHALERLAQGNSDQRQTIVDVICAYLRMPYTPPDDQTPGEDAPEDAHRRYEQRRQELQVRMTAQRILTAHLNPGVAALFWTGINLDLTEAYLHQLDLTACHVRCVWFDRATFAGGADFRGAKFDGDAWFSEAKFTGDAEFNGAKFDGDAWFSEAKFTGDAGFNVAKFDWGAWFRGAKFDGDAWFSEAKFDGGADFRGAKFDGDAWFRVAKFARHAWFSEAKFDGEAGFSEGKFADAAIFTGATFARDAWFSVVEFAGPTVFDGAEFAEAAGFDGAEFGRKSWFSEKFLPEIPAFDEARVASSSGHIVLPMGWITRAAQPTEGEDEGWLYAVRDKGSSEQAAEATDGGEGQNSSGTKA